MVLPWSKTTAGRGEGEGEGGDWGRPLYHSQVPSPLRAMMAGSCMSSTSAGGPAVVKDTCREGGGVNQVVTGPNHFHNNQLLCSCGPCCGQTHLQGGRERSTVKDAVMHQAYKCNQLQILQGHDFLADKPDSQDCTVLHMRFEETTAAANSSDSLSMLAPANPARCAQGVICALMTPPRTTKH